MEGSPQVKARIRGLRHQMRRRKLQGGLSRAQRSGHQSDALRGGAGVQLRNHAASDGAGKGPQSAWRLRIREEAQWAGVPIVENPPLARSLYKSVEEGQPIPYELYAAVAGDSGVPLPPAGGESGARAQAGRSCGDSAETPMVDAGSEAQR